MNLLLHEPTDRKSEITQYFVGLKFCGYV